MKVVRRHVYNFCNLLYVRLCSLSERNSVLTRIMSILAFLNLYVCICNIYTVAVFWYNR